ncbi:hypothetical protein GIB67_016376 [Kingdonia uniflora]|uniref:Uncharacterized protein n=1 Tax=Kingdonia uniflora TaxID=39325 RepID=A0A7J7MH83_9MAGN|nr:hypothetical protein GIB67_016376 [Kingdonia uniflora]
MICSDKKSRGCIYLKLKRVHHIPCNKFVNHYINLNNTTTRRLLDSPFPHHLSYSPCITASPCSHINIRLLNISNIFSHPHSVTRFKI